jgi:acetyl esterase
MTAATPWIHPEARATLERIAASGEPPLETLSAAEARQVADQRVLRTSGKGPKVGEVTERLIPGPAQPIALRLYKPGAASVRQRLPILIYLHGGGYVVGNIETADAVCRELAVRAECLVVSVGYRLAPEHKFPAAVEDSYAAALWTARHAEAIGGDAQRIAIGGESAGGTLAAVVAQLARASHDFALVLQIMIYPMTDLRTDAASYDRLGTGFFLTRRKMQWFIDHYVSGPEDLDDPRGSPLRARSFGGLPPALIITAELDPLVDEGLAYSEKLKEAGVPTDYRCYAGWPHGFMYWDGSEAQRDALADTAAALRRVFAPSHESRSSAS